MEVAPRAGTCHRTPPTHHQHPPSCPLYPLTPNDNHPPSSHTHPPTKAHKSAHPHPPTPTHTSSSSSALASSFSASFSACSSAAFSAHISKQSGKRTRGSSEDCFWTHTHTHTRKQHSKCRRGSTERDGRDRDAGTGLGDDLLCTQKQTHYNKRAGGSWWERHRSTPAQGQQRTLWRIKEGLHAGTHRAYTGIASGRARAVVHGEG